MKYSDELHTQIKQLQIELNHPPKIEEYKSKVTFKPLSLFTGCGGLDLGFRVCFKFRSKEYAKNLARIIPTKMF